MDIFIRHAAHTNYLPNRMFTRAYDARFLFITEGTGTVHFLDNAETFSPDTLIYYPAGTTYLPIPDDFAQIKFVTLNFDFDHLNTDQTTAMPPVAMALFEENKAIMSHLKTDIPVFQKPFVLHHLTCYRNLFLEVVEEHQMMTERSKETSASLLQYICCKLAEYGTNRSRNICLDVMNYISENYRTIASNAEIAEHFNYHPFYLSSVFKRETGTSLHHYIMDFKLSKGAELLLSSQMSIAEIAGNVGFHNADHFSKCFAQKFERTPTAYRREGMLV